MQAWNAHAAYGHPSSADVTASTIRSIHTPSSGAVYAAHRSTGARPNAMFTPSNWVAMVPIGTFEVPYYSHRHRGGARA
jgi:hypothetical protein